MKENIDIRLLAAKEAIKSEMFEEAINILDELERFNFENYYTHMKRTSLWHRSR